MRTLQMCSYFTFIYLTFAIFFRFMYSKNPLSKIINMFWLFCFVDFFIFKPYIYFYITLCTHFLNWEYLFFRHRTFPFIFPRLEKQSGNSRIGKCISSEWTFILNILISVENLSSIVGFVNCNLKISQQILEFLYILRFSNAHHLLGDITSFFS